jgi:NAD(P)-dependent dehydrogenase (short-subunit alcohol dehydrogenase family)
VASGLGEAVVRKIISSGGMAAILDVGDGSSLVKELGEKALYFKTDVSSENEVQAAIDGAVKKFGLINTAVNCAGITKAAKTAGSKGPFKLDMFELVIKINLTGTFNVIRLAASKMSENDPGEDGERGVIISTSSVAAFDGQTGQAAYAASKSGIAGMTLPIARDLAPLGIRNVTIAPGLFETPMMSSLPDDVKVSLAKQVPFPSRLGRPAEFAELVSAVIVNKMINGETIRLDGAIRMAAK